LYTSLRYIHSIIVQTDAKPMMELYHHTNLECSKLITQRYSTSFSLGIRAFDKEFRAPIYAIYGFVRFADEIVDTFHDFDKKMLLDEFRADTYKAIERGISLNPVLHSFQQVVNEYQIDHELIDAFLESMEMDLYNKLYESQYLYEKYIYGSAEVVGLMCLQVFCKSNKAQYEALKPAARSLGAAFQKVNFLRDMTSDMEERGRVYFPGIDFGTFDEHSKIEIVKDIQKDFDDALEGIKQLPSGARRGVYLAYIYYLKLFKKIEQAPIDRMLSERIRVPDRQKALLLGKTVFQNMFGLF
jgi:15-cis-phytoene synthase